MPKGHGLCPTYDDKRQHGENRMCPVLDDTTVELSLWLGEWTITVVFGEPLVHERAVALPNLQFQKQWVLMILHLTASRVFLCSPRSTRTAFSQQPYRTLEFVHRTAGVI